MIAKNVPMKNVTKSSFKRLVEYLANPQDTKHRILGGFITNCMNVDIFSAMMEILTTQNQNTKTKKDKTYHLLFSFRPGESLPSREVLMDIEKNLCDALGFNDHQRISVIHGDTDNYHIHIAINKIHPQTYKIREPYRDYDKLAKVCTRMEEKHHLQCDNHQIINSVSMGKAKDMEKHSGQQSLLSYIRKNCAAFVMKALTWQELHKSLALYDVRLKKRANGLIFESKGIILKASTVNRQFSLKSLEKRFGEFEECGKLDIKPILVYDGKPLNVQNEDLNFAYKMQMQQAQIDREQMNLELYEQFQSGMEMVHLNRRVGLNMIKLLGGDSLTRKILYSRLKNNTHRQIQEVYSDYRDARSALVSQTQHLRWNDWLKDQAKKGNSLALKEMQNRVRREQKHSGLLIQGKVVDAVPRQQLITKEGTIVYSQNVRENAHGIIVAEKADKTDLFFAALLAKQRLQNYQFIGDEKKVQIVKEIIHDRSRGATGTGISGLRTEPGLGQNDRRRSDGRGNGDAESARTSAAGRNGNTKHYAHSDRVAASGSAASAITHSFGYWNPGHNLDDFARITASTDRRSVLRLSLGYMARDQKQGAKLLQNNAHLDLGQRTTGRLLDSLRRNHDKSRGIVPPAMPVVTPRQSPSSSIGKHQPTKPKGRR